MILHCETFYFGKTCAETLNFSLPKKLDHLRKNKLFRDRGPVYSFCSRYPNICDRIKKMVYNHKNGKCFLGFIGFSIFRKLDPHVYDIDGLAGNPMEPMKSSEWPPYWIPRYSRHLLIPICHASLSIQRNWICHWIRYFLAAVTYQFTKQNPITHLGHLFVTLTKLKFPYAFYTCRALTVINEPLECSLSM
jgi:hypothetical protein